MCGFLAAFGGAAGLLRAELCELGNLLRHRGPDSSQFKSSDDFFLCFHRLAIQDTNARSDQPMVDGTGRYVLVFNGEIYNYPELRSELARRGHVFRTSGDSEVLLQGLILEGSNFLSKLEGMFSLILWDTHEKRLIVARDPFGIKPLYYLEVSGTVLFASEPRPLRMFARDSVNSEALPELLVFRHSAHDSLFTRIRSLPGGHSLSGPPNRLMQTAYADPLSLLHDNDSPGEPNEFDIEQLIRHSVHMHARSDVGFAVQLSGGVDSSLIASICASSHTPKPESYGAHICGYEYDEEQYRSLVVNRYALCHREVPITGAEFAATLPAAIFALDAPTPHYGCVALFIVCREIARTQKVVLTGEGADEMFGGYSRYLEVDKYHPVPQHDDGYGDLPASSVLFCSAYSGLAVFRGLFRSLDFSFRARRALASRFPDVLRQMMALDHQYYLSSLLMRQDRISMAHGLEARVPFVYWPLAKALSKIPVSRRMPLNDTKPLLKRTARKYLPACVIDRSKNGLLLPIERWLRDDNALGRYLCALTDSSARLADYVDRRALRAMVDDFRRAKGNSANSALMQILNVELWLRSLDRGLESFSS